MSSNPMPKVKPYLGESKPAPLSRFEKMVETGIWTSRLNKRQRYLFAELGASLRAVDEGLGQAASMTSGSAHQELLSSLKREVSSAYREILPELIEIAVVAADNVFTLDSRVKEQRLYAEDARKRAELLEEKLSKTFSEKLLQFLRSRQGEKIEDENSQAAQENESPYDGFYSVDNTGTPFSIFKNWATVFNINGKRYGSSTPAIHDSAEIIIEFHEHYSLKDKVVLELGPFEGAKTKQILELGAKQVHGIEANPEAFLKCLVLKNELGLDNFSIDYGDINTLLAPERLKELPSFDCCVASGVLYHMEDPLYTIDLIAGSAPVAYVWSQVASDVRPKTPWIEVQDSVGRKYQARENSYEEEQHWGGIGKGSLWLAPESMTKAFNDRGFDVTVFEEGFNAGGKFISFMARRSKF